MLCAGHPLGSHLVGAGAVEVELGGLLRFCLGWIESGNAARTDGNDDGSDDDFDGLATDEAAAIAEAMAEAAALNTTLQCHLGAKRQHEDDAQPEVPQQV